MGEWLAMLEPEIAPSTKETKATLNDKEESTILSWLDHIEETDPDFIEGVLEQCRADSEARAYFLRRSEEVPKGRHCAECLHFNRIDHPRLGRCAAGEAEPIAGLWDTDRRYCRSYTRGAVLITQTRQLVSD